METMQHARLRLLPLFLLSFVAAVAASSPDAVLDVEGNVLRVESLLDALPVSDLLVGNELQGGLKPAAIDVRCPLRVVEAPTRHYKGEPLWILPENSSQGTVREGDGVYFKFLGPTGCPESPMWIYNEGEDTVTTGGHTSTDTPSPNFSRFAIYKSNATHEMFDRTYQIKPCPCKKGADTARLCGIPCFGSLGVDFVDGNYPLSVKSNNATDFVFQKVTQLGIYEPTIRTVV